MERLYRGLFCSCHYIKLSDGQRKAMEAYAQLVLSRTPNEVHSAPLEGQADLLWKKDSQQPSLHKCAPSSTVFACTLQRRSEWLLCARPNSGSACTETFCGGCFHEEQQAFAKELKEATLLLLLLLRLLKKYTEDASSGEKHVQRSEATLLLHLAHCHGDPELPGEDAATQ